MNAAWYSAYREAFAMMRVNADFVNDGEHVCGHPIAGRSRQILYKLLHSSVGCDGQAVR